MKLQGKAAIAKKIYLNKALRSKLRMNSFKILYKSNKRLVQMDKETYRKRNVVEISFSSLKENHRIATRYEKTAKNYLTMVQLGSIRLYIKLIFN